jgi:hypothetical protein
MTKADDEAYLPPPYRPPLYRLHIVNHRLAKL